MKKLFTMSFILLCAIMIIPQFSSASESNTTSIEKEKKKKKKKEKKPFVWVLPELTKNKDINTYLLTCDTVYNEINTYRDSIRYFSVRRADTGEKDDTGKPIYMSQIIDDKGDARTPGDAFKQTLEIIGTGMNILSDGVILSTMTLTATTALPNLGFDALKYAKYIKAGPQIIGIGAKEVQFIIEKLQAQQKAIKILKESSTNTAEDKNVVMLSSESPEGIDYKDTTSEEINAAAAAVIAGMSEEEKEEMMKMDNDDLFD